MKNLDFDKIIFLNETHKDNFLYCCEQHSNTGRYLHCEELPVFYLLSLAVGEQTNLIHAAYDFKERVIKPECLKGAWQTSSTMKACLLAFNLWNGYMPAKYKVKTTPYEIFCSSWAPYFVQALRLRYDCYF